MSDPTDPDRLFAYHRPLPENVERIKTLRSAHRYLGRLIREHVPTGPSQTLALRALHQCMMHCSYGIVENDPVAD